MTIVQKFSAAAGQQDGDTLTLANQWASLTLTRDGASGKHIWLVSGDCSLRGFPQLQDAVTFALQTLAEYERGRA